MTNSKAQAHLTNEKQQSNSDLEQAFVYVEHGR